MQEYRGKDNKPVKRFSGAKTVTIQFSLCHLNILTGCIDVANYWISQNHTQTKYTLLTKPLDFDHGSWKSCEFCVSILRFWRHFSTEYQQRPKDMWKYLHFLSAWDTWETSSPLLCQLTTGWVIVHWQAPFIIMIIYGLFTWFWLD